VASIIERIDLDYASNVMRVRFGLAAAAKGLKIPEWVESILDSDKTQFSQH
jgi:hypothetical protein